MHFRILTACLFTLVPFSTTGIGGDGNRLVYLDDPSNPYYVHQSFPRLVTPQWVGEQGVKAVITLGIDDMRDPAAYERYLRPILNRLIEIDGRAPVSIMTNSVNPQDPQLASWIKEGLSIECHTIDHPCPCLTGSNFAAARSTYERCVDLMAAIPGNHPVAFRFPCMDSMNTPSPRAFAEILNRTTAAGNYLTISTSVSCFLTSNDPELPRELVIDDQQRARFTKYSPFASYVNKVENYPYPFVIGRQIWEFPTMVPDDWQGQHLHRPFNPQTVEDYKAASDATVLKEGVANFVFHPGGWIRNGQLVDIIDHLDQKHGKQIKFLSFRECQARLNEHLLAGQPIRAANGQDNGVRLLDLDHDGFLDVVIGNEKTQKTRIWLPEQQRWEETDFPVQIVHVDTTGNRHQAGVHFFVTRPDGQASLLVRNEREAGVWHFVEGRWQRDNAMLAGLEINGQPIATHRADRDLGVRLRDLDGDGDCELIAGGPDHHGVFQWDAARKSWQQLPFQLPQQTAITTDQGYDAGLRFVDIDHDGHDDVLFSNASRYSLHLFSSLANGWSRHAQSATRPDGNAIPMIVRGNTNNGAWFADSHMWIQNEDTPQLPNGVDRRAFVDLLGDTVPTSLEPEASLQAIETRPGYRVELVAAEPLVMDPVAFDWGPDGRLWVVEMADYPLGLDDRGKPGGRVRYLEDRDGDGQYESSTLFATGLSYPSDIMAWRRGVLVTAAPHIWYLEDTNQDGRADRREPWFQGFGEGNQQHRVNGLRWGLDNWVYVANGDSGGTVQSTKTDDSVTINGRDLRIRPDSGQLAAATGQTQHGRIRDDWGNWWGANNSFPMYQYLLKDSYLRRNPHVPPPSPRVNIVTLNNAPIHPISRVLSHYSNYRKPAPGEPGRFTSACSTIVYRDQHLGPEFYGNMFVSAPVHNLVHRRVIEWDGIQMTSRKPAGEENREFLRSRDSWFRPTTLRTGPDGGLWVADMYRLVIEHPEWIDDTVEKTLELRAGHDKGRIYRVVPVDRPTRKIPNLATLNTRQLVQRLADPNGWVRDMAHRLLLWRPDVAAAAPLLANAVSGSPSALQRLHALCVLDGLGAVTADQVIAGMQDVHPGVRRHAARIAEKFAGEPDSRKVAAAIIALATQQQPPQVILQAAFSLGEFDHAAAGRALGTLLVRYSEEPYLAAAVISGVTQRTSDVLAGARDAVTAGSETLLPIEPLVQTALGMKNPQTVASLVDELLVEQETGFAPWQFESLGAVQRAIQVSGKSLDEVVTSDAARKRLTKLRHAARRTLLNEEASSTLRSTALALLGDDPVLRGLDASVLASLLSPQTPVDLQQAAINTIAAAPDERMVPDVLAQWETFGPLTRDRLVGGLLRRVSTTSVLLSALTAKQIHPVDINATYRQTLVNHPDSSIAQASAKLLDITADGKRQAIIDRYLTVTKGGGQPERGRQFFTKTCAQCHKIGSQGHAVGPSLIGLKDKSPQFLTTHILDPNRAIEDKFRNYILITEDGRHFTGLLQNETSTSVTLVGLNGVSHTILKKQIEAEGFQRTRQSMMPSGLEKFLQPRDLADLIAFVIKNQEPPKSFEGNQPRVVAVEPNTQVLRLRATHAEIYGPSLVFESRYRNLGFWHSADDRALWTVEVSAAGQYDVYLDWAVDQSTANNPYLLEIGDQKLTGRVAATGTWDDYHQTRLGTVTLSQGQTRAAFRAVGKPTNCLIDLRELCLVPAGKKPPAPFKLKTPAPTP